MYPLLPRAEAGEMFLVFVETWHLGFFEKDFRSKRKHAAQVGGEKRERWRWFAKQLQSQFYSVWTALQPMFYGLWLHFATRTSRVDCHVNPSSFRQEG